MESCRASRSLVERGTLWSIMEPYGALWSFMEIVEPGGALQSIVMEPVSKLT